MNKKVTLELAFLDASGNSKKLNINNPEMNITPEVAQGVLEGVSNSGVFVDYQTPVSARYIIRDSQDLYIA